MTQEESRVTREAMPVGSIGDLERRVSKLNHRAKKLGVAELRVEVTNRRNVPIPPRGPGEPIRYREVVDAAVVGETPHLAGWVLVAVLDHDGPETVLRRVPGYNNLDLTRYRDAGPYCSHCSTTRRRLETFIVLNERGVLYASMNLLTNQVGRNCLTDFFGQSPEAVIWLAGWIREIGDMFDSMSNGHTEILVDSLAFLSYVSSCIRVDGWMSRTRANQTGLPATALDAWSLSNPPESHDTKWQKFAEKRIPTDDDRALATTALAWARELDPMDSSDYLSTLGRVARQDVVKGKNTGILASAVASYIRERDREARFQREIAESKNEHFGEIKKRYKGLVLEFIKATPHASDFGPTTLISLRTAEGHRLKWWASGHKSEFIDGRPGQHLIADFTVKSHGEWKERLETGVTRLVVKEWQA